jgi:hypothetical protein
MKEIKRRRKRRAERLKGRKRAAVVAAGARKASRQ